MSLVKQGLEHPPLGLHELGVHGLVAMIKVDPATHTLDSRAPFCLITHDNGPTLGIVLGNTHRQDIFLALDSQLLVDLVFDR